MWRTLSVRPVSKEITAVLDRLGIYEYSFSATSEVVIAALLLVALVASALV